ncbi:MAG: PAS domain-containing sensor histidine kinase [Ideonella sp.]|nr:PAS domain-containing sensor histidine kinase [Ideonella sp.]
MNEAESLAELRKALADAQRRLDAVVQVSGGPLGTLEFELRGDGALVFVRSDDVARQLITVAAPSFYGKRILEVFTGMTGTDLPDVLAATAREGRAMSTRQFVPPGTRLARAFSMFAFQVAPGRVVLKFWDSSALAETQEIGRRNQELLAQIFSDSPMAIALTREHEGVIVDVNSEWSRLTGWPRQEVLGRTPAELGLWRDAADLAPALDALRHQGTVHNLELPLRTREGGDVVVAMHAAGIDIGQVAHHLVYLLDITDRKRADAQLQLLNTTLEARVLERTRDLAQRSDELVRAEKLASLGSLVAGVAHELNTPIGNAVMVASTLSGRQREFEAGMASGLRRSALEGFLSTTREVSDVLERNLQRAAELIGSFKQLAVDQSSYQRREFEVSQVVQEVALAISPTLRRHRTQLIDDTPAGLHMDSFPGPLGQVFINLVNNAVLHAFEVGQAGCVRIGAVQVAADRVRLVVSDNGRGMQAAHVKQIFDPFFTTKLGQGGSGMGLHIVYTLVTGLLGGRIEVRSAPAQGTEFIIELPRVAPAPQPEQPSTV